MKRLKMLGVGKANTGYTIVETIIFLAVSGMLLVSVGTMINGRQERTRFSQSIDNMSQNLRDVLNDVSVGYFPSNNNVRCTPNGSVPPNNLSFVVDDTVEQGKNTGCVFIGKILEFPPDSTDYNIYTAVSNKDATSLSESVIEMLNRGSNPGVSDIKTNNINLRTSKIVDKNTNQNFTALAVLSDFGNITGASVSGNAGNVKLYGIPALGSEQVSTDEADLVPISGDSVVVICLVQEESDNSRKGYITITPQLSIDRIIGEEEPSCA